MDLDIRTLRREEMPLVIDAAAREGWNPGLHDAAPQEEESCDSHHAAD